MQKKWRPILATAAVLCVAAWMYLHDVHTPLDLSTVSYPFDQDHGKLSDIPAEFRKLDGQKVVADGYVIPLDQTEQIRRFALEPWIPSEPGTAATLQQVVDCTCNPMKYISDKVRVYGRLHVFVQLDGEFIVSVYQMDVDRIECTSTRPAARWPWLIIAAVPVAVIAVMLPRSAIRRHFQLAGRCTGCGYDLRATPSRCPECGASYR
jgi:hypothetical protein